MLDRTFFALLCCVGALPAASAAGAGTPAPAGGAGSTYLLIGQNWQQEFSDYVSGTGSPPAGASFYTSQLEPGQPLAWQGDGLAFLEHVNATYADPSAPFLAEVTLAWKYSPGGCESVRALSIDIANGKFDAQLSQLGEVFSSMPGISFLLRVEYEVS